jgi:hypothetical protein
VRQFNDAPDHRGRAGFLLTMPVFTAMKYRETLIAACEVTGFEPGRQYLIALYMALSGRRYRGAFAEHSSELVMAETRLLGFADGYLTGDRPPSGERDP